MRFMLERSEIQKQIYDKKKKIMEVLEEKSDLKQLFFEIDFKTLKQNNAVKENIQVKLKQQFYQKKLLQTAQNSSEKLDTKQASS